MDESMVQFLIEMRKEMFHGESTKHKEIVDKFDELILAQLNAPIKQDQ